MTIEEIEQSIASYGEDVFRFCCYLTGNRSSAEDLYQDTFLKAMEIARPVEPDMAGKFLAGVAANLWKNQWRKEKRRQKYVMQNISPENGTQDNWCSGWSMNCRKSTVLWYFFITAWI